MGSSQSRGTQATLGLRVIGVDYWSFKTRFIASLHLGFVAHSELYWIIATLTKHTHRPVIGILWQLRDLSGFSGAWQSNHWAKLANTSPVEHIGR